MRDIRDVRGEAIRQKHYVDKRRHRLHISRGSMLKRLTAIFFIFLIAGQVSAAVCGCLGGESQPQHSCCKHERSANDSLRQKGCCDNDCAMSQSERLPQDRTITSFKITSKAVAEPATPKLEKFVPITTLNIARTISAIDQRLTYSRPPELYLRHHAFLI